MPALEWCLHSRIERLHQVDSSAIVDGVAYEDWLESPNEMGTSSLNSVLLLVPNDSQTTLPLVRGFFPSVDGLESIF